VAARAYSTAPVAEPPEDEMGTRWNEFLRCVDPKMTKNMGYTWVMNPVGGLPFKYHIVPMGEYPPK
jgi:hypothetical protein